MTVNHTERERTETYMLYQSLERDDEYVHTKCFFLYPRTETDVWVGFSWSFNLYPDLMSRNRFPARNLSTKIVKILGHLNHSVKIYWKFKYKLTL